MMIVSVKAETAGAMHWLDNLHRRQIPFATALALTRTAQAAKREVHAEMLRAFDRPTPFTLNSLQVVPATKHTLHAEVKFREFASKGTAAGKYLKPQVFGGPRDAKRFEKNLRHAGALPPGKFIVPGRDARLNQYGGQMPSEIVRILSALRAMPDPLQNRGRKRKKAVDYRIVRRGTMPVAIMRTGSARGIVMAFVRQPSYRKRFRFFETITSVVRTQYERIFRATLDHAIRSTR